MMTVCSRGRWAGRSAPMSSALTATAASGSGRRRRPPPRLRAHRDRAGDSRDRLRAAAATEGRARQAAQALHRASPRAPAPAPVQPSMLIDDKTALETPAPASTTPEPQRLPANAMSRIRTPSSPGCARAARPAPASCSRRATSRCVRGSGNVGEAGRAVGRAVGLASIGTADAAAAAGVTSFARPLGGYQTLPRYPEIRSRERASRV